MDDWYWIRAVMFKGAWLSASGDVADGRGGTWGRHARHMTKEKHEDKEEKEEEKERRRRKSRRTIYMYTYHASAFRPAKCLFFVVFEH